MVVNNILNYSRVIFVLLPSLRNLHMLFIHVDVHIRCMATTFTAIAMCSRRLSRPQIGEPMQGPLLQPGGPGDRPTPAEGGRGQTSERQAEGGLPGGGHPAEPAAGADPADAVER